MKMKSVDSNIPELWLVFDVDSTINSFEALDTIIEIAAREHFAQMHSDENDDQIEKRVQILMKEIEKETASAMEGSGTLEETIPARLSAAVKFGVTVNQSHINHVIEKAKKDETAHRIAQIVLAKKEEYQGKINIRMALVSGGPIEVIEATAKLVSDIIGAPVDFHANEIVINSDGTCNEEASKISNYKDETVRDIINNKLAVMIGDGGTDLKVFTEKVVKYFIQAGYVIHRKKVCEKLQEHEALLDRAFVSKTPASFSAALERIIQESIQK